MKTEASVQPSAIKKTILWALVGGIYALICYLSFQTGEETTQLSSFIASFLENLTGMSPEQALALAQGLRKAAHMIEFGALTAALYPAIRVTAPRNLWLWVVSLALCIALAIFSEVFKVFIPGRHLDFGEMMFNLLGCAVGILLGMAVHLCWRTLRKVPHQP